MTAHVTIAEACSLVTDGTHYTPVDIGTGYPFLTVKDVSDAGLDFDGCARISEEDYSAADLGNSAPKPGDVLFSKDGTVGKVHVVKTTEQFAVLSSLAILRPAKGVLSDYLGHVLRFPKVLDEALKRKTGSAIRRIVLSDLKQVRVPLPSVAEQRRIAAILDKTDALRTKRREALAQLDRLAQSIFKETFTEELTSAQRWPVQDFVKEFRYGTSEKSGSQGRPTLRIPNVVGEKVDCRGLKTVAVSAAEFERLRLVDNDMLFVRTNGNPDYVGRSAVFNRADVADSGFSADSFIYASYLIRARLNVEELLPCVLQAYLQTAEGKHQIRSRCKTSAGQFNINTEGLGAILVPKFARSKQVSFEATLSTLRRQRERSAASGTGLERLCGSLQHRAFQGEL